MLARVVTLRGDGGRVSGVRGVRGAVRAGVDGEEIEN